MQYMCRNVARSLAFAFLVLWPAIPLKAERSESAIHISMPLEAPPATVDASAARLLAKPLVDVKGVYRVEVVSRDGGCTAVLRLNAGAEVEAVRLHVRDVLARILPDLPNGSGPVIVGKGDPDELAPVWIALTGDEHTTEVLGTVARDRVRSPLTRIAGITDAEVIGGAESSVTIRLDPRRLAATGTTVGDVTRAVADASKALPKPGAVSPAELDAVILRTVAGAAVRIRDVGVVERTAVSDAFARVGGKPAVIIPVQTSGAPETAAIDRELADIRVGLPAGMKLTVAADLSGRAGCLIEGRPPAGASPDERLSVLSRAAATAQSAAGPTAHVLAFTRADRDTFRLVVADVNRPIDLASLQKAFATFPGGDIRVCGVGGDAKTVPFPVRLGLTGDDPAMLRRWSNAVAKRLTAGPAVTNVQVFPAPEVEQRTVRIDRERAKRVGLTIEHVQESVPFALGKPTIVPIGDGQSVRVRLDSDQPMADVRLRGGDGQLVPLQDVLELQSVHAPAEILRIGTSPAMQVSASPVAGRTVAEVIKACLEAAAEEAKALNLNAAYRPLDLTR